MAKPLVFISHTHEDSLIASAIEDLIETALLGSVEVFNTSNRESIAPGQPWRDLIIQNLSNCAAALIISTPQSVVSPWVNFESGGAWVSEKQVIPCCARGMRISSLPAPLSHLQALEVTEPDDLRQLIEFLAKAASLQSPKHVNYSEAAQKLEESWSPEAKSVEDETTIRWLQAAMLRPQRHKGERTRSIFKLSQPSAVDTIVAQQFYGEKMVPGDTIRCWAEHQSLPHKTLFYCFANPVEAEELLEHGLPGNFRVSLRCLGQVKVIETDMVSFGDEDRGIGYYPAFAIEDVEQF
jgi:TIR domain